MVEIETNSAFYKFLETKGAYKEYMQKEFNRLREQFELDEKQATIAFFCAAGIDMNFIIENVYNNDPANFK